MTKSPYQIIEEALEKARVWDEFGGQPIFEQALTLLRELKQGVPELGGINLNAGSIYGSDLETLIKATKATQEFIGHE